MKTVGDTLVALNISEWQLDGEPTNETEFNAQFKKIMSVDSDGTPVLSSDVNDFGVTWQQITDKQQELQIAYENNEYQRKRASEYPSIEEQLDKIYHSGVTGWKSTIKAIKDKYPKE